MNEYAAFIASKSRVRQAEGPALLNSDVHPLLADWQADVVTWAVRQGRAAIWADTGLGKTLMQLEWARHMGERVLIIAPLAVCHQTVREASKLDLTAAYARSDNEADGPGLWVTNLERASAFDAAGFDAVVLDEASILKQHDGATRRALTEQWSATKYRLACTATPAPNDSDELTTQAEWLGVTTRVEMLAAYYVHDDEGWRLKGHARGPMFQWMASWAVALRNPSDLGYDDTGWDLPPLNVHPHLLPVDVVPEGQLFATDLGGVGGRAKVRKATLNARVAKVAELVAAEPDEPWLIWCELNDESEALARLIPGAVEVAGSMTPEDKAERLLGFADGTIRVLITKPKIAAFGLNWQQCARVAFCGLSDSWESYYQAVRRCWRHGQTRPVNVHVVVSSLEGQVLANVQRKERHASALVTELISSVLASRSAA